MDEKSQGMVANTVKIVMRNLDLTATLIENLAEAVYLQGRTTALLTMESYDCLTNLKGELPLLDEKVIIAAALSMYQAHVWAIKQVVPDYDGGK